MAQKRDTDKADAPPRRLNRAVGLGEALGRTLDPVLKKRGFASRDLITHWAAMVPSPYDAVTRADRLNWPRGARGPEGATLYLRCAPGHALAVAHDGATIAAAINRYFGYVLVGAVRLSAEPLELAPQRPNPQDVIATPEVQTRIDARVADVADDGLREALRTLGVGVARKRAR